jgi:hypothetical protein
MGKGTGTRGADQRLKWFKRITYSRLQDYKLPGHNRRMNLSRLTIFIASALSSGSATFFVTGSGSPRSSARVFSLIPR